MKKYLAAALAAGALAPLALADDVTADTLVSIQNEVHFRMHADGTFYQVSGDGPTTRENTVYYDCTGADYRLTGSVPRWHEGDINSFAPENPGVTDTLINLISFAVVVPAAAPASTGDVIVRFWNLDPTQCNATNGLFDTQIGGIRFNDVNLAEVTGGTIFFFDDIAIDDVFPTDGGLIFPTDTYGYTIELRNSDDTPHALWTSGFATNLVNVGTPTDPANCVDPLNQPLVGSSFVNATPAALYLRDADGNGIMTSGAAACPAPPTDIRGFAAGCPGNVIANMYLKLSFDPPPTADAGADITVTDSDNTGEETVNLDGSNSIDDTFVANWTWDEGATELGTGATLSSSFTVGVHTVTLTVEDEFGVTSTDDVIVTVNPGGGGGCACQGDFDNDGDRDIGDLALLLSNFGRTDSPDSCSGNLDGDSDVDITDLAIMLSNFGQPC